MDTLTESIAIPECAKDPVLQSLESVRPGQRVSLQSIMAGKRLRERLLSMGLPPGAIFEVLRNRGGAVVVARDTSRLAIGKGMAAKIWVRDES